jgi:hypothetical protein
MTSKMLTPIAYAFEIASKLGIRDSNVMKPIRIANMTDNTTPASYGSPVLPLSL